MFKVIAVCFAWFGSTWSVLTGFSSHSCRNDALQQISGKRDYICHSKYDMYKCVFVRVCVYMSCFEALLNDARAFWNYTIPTFTSFFCPRKDKTPMNECGRVNVELKTTKMNLKGERSLWGNRSSSSSSSSLKSHTRKSLVLVLTFAHLLSKSTFNHVND